MIGIDPQDFVSTSFRCQSVMSEKGRVSKQRKTGENGKKRSKSTRGFSTTDVRLELISETSFLYHLDINELCLKRERSGSKGRQARTEKKDKVNTANLKVEVRFDLILETSFSLQSYPYQ